MSMPQGKIVDATLITASSSTKNKERKLNPEMHQTKKIKPVVFRNESPRRRGQELQPNPFGGGFLLVAGRHIYKKLLVMNLEKPLELLFYSFYGLTAPFPGQ